MEISAQEGLATLTDPEHMLWDAVHCGDLEVDIKVKKSPELRRLTKGNRRQWADGVYKRDQKAGQLIPWLKNAMAPEIIRNMLSAMMSARVERDMLLEAGRAMVSAPDPEAKSEAALRLLTLIEGIEARNER